MSILENLATANILESESILHYNDAIATSPAIDSLNFERIVRSKIKNVFAWFTSAESLKQWLAPAASMEPHLGGKLSFRWDEKHSASGRILEISRPTSFKISWRDENGDFSRLGFNLSSNGIYTTVALQQDLLQSAVVHEWKQRTLCRWIFHLDNLCSVIERGRDLRSKKAKETGWEWLEG